MKSINFFFVIGLLPILCFNYSCNEEVPYDCQCDAHEVCVANECHLSENVHELGGTRIIAPNSYVGVVSNNPCVDTLVFYCDTTRAIDDDRFGLIVPHYYVGIQNVAGSFPVQISDKEYYLGTAAELCYLNGEGRYANLHFIIEPDNVWMKIKFYTLNIEPGLFIDSCEVTFYRKE